jgi:hypothetical protein
LNSGERLHRPLCCQAHHPGHLALFLYGSLLMFDLSLFLFSERFGEFCSLLKQDY